MSTPQMSETAEVRRCRTCAAELRQCDRYCRRCGVNQTDELAAKDTEPLTSELCQCETRGLSEAESGYQSFSGALVNTLAQSVSVRTKNLGAGRFATRLLTALVAVPLWLLIVMLSPLDAFTAAKAATGQLSSSS